MAYATALNIADRLGRDLDESETRIVTARLGDAELLIKSRIPGLDEQIVAGTLNQAVVVMVEADAVLRLIRNPDGYKAETDGNYSYEIDQNVASGRLKILDEEWAMLGIRAAVFTIAPRMEMPLYGPEGRDISEWMPEDDTAVWA